MRSILVIEDDEDLRLMLRQTLVSAGYEVRAAADGKEAMSLCQAQPPDLVVTDLYMPNKDGLEVIMELQTQMPQTKIIAISGQVAKKNMLPVAARLGAIRTLAKPFTPQELLQTVQTVLPLGAQREDGK